MSASIHLFYGIKVEYNSELHKEIKKLDENCEDNHWDEDECYLHCNGEEGHDFCVGTELLDVDWGNPLNLSEVMEKYTPNGQINPEILDRFNQELQKAPQAVRKLLKKELPKLWLMWGGD